MMNILSYATLRNECATICGHRVTVLRNDGKDFMTDLYHTLGIQYPKFFKMDALSKAGFLGAELVMRQSGEENEEPKRDLSVIFMNRSSSLDDDMTYQHTIAHNNYYPSPAVFVYTLANIVTGEVAIRNKIYGESSFYVAREFSAKQMLETIKGGFEDPEINRILCGWTEVLDNQIDVMTMLVTKNEAGTREFNEDNINNIYNNKL